MRTIFQSLLGLLTKATDRELARQVQFLKIENEILRSRLKTQVRVTPQERQRLLRFGRPLGKAIRHLITIVSPRTFLRWLQGGSENKKPARLGRPPTPLAARAVVLRLARETGWGATRIHGELKKLGQANVSRSTVANLLRAEGLDPGPRRGEATWNEFIRRHAETLWACDFFAKKIWTPTGLVQVFVLFFLHLGSRRVHIAGLTPHPDAAWMEQTAHQTARFFAAQPVPPTKLLRDFDDKFVPAFDRHMQSAGLEVIPVGPCAPNLNAHAERFVLSIKSECLDHFLVFGEAHLRHLIAEYLAHYHEERPHQGLNNNLLSGQSPPANSTGKILCQQRLGGLLKHYHRQAA